MILGKLHYFYLKYYSKMNLTQNLNGEGHQKYSITDPAGIRCPAQKRQKNLLLWNESLKANINFLMYSSAALNDYTIRYN